jgi:hypothetical protein
VIQMSLRMLRSTVSSTGPVVAKAVMSGPIR